MKHNIRFSVGSKTARRAGFTLVEVLVTLVIMGGIMVSMTQILTAARNTRDMIHNIEETQLAGPAILDLLERDIRGVVTYDRTKQLHLRVKNRVLLGMDADSIDFVTTADSLSLTNLSDRFVKADINEVGYRLRPSTEFSDQFLEIYRREDFGVDDDPFEDGVFMFLHDRVKSFDIQCFAADGRDEQPIDEWGSEVNAEHIGLPARIEVTLILELAPRLVNEQMIILPSERRTLTYRRVIRFPEGLRGVEEEIPVPKIPTAPAAGAQPGQANNATSATGGAATGAGGGGRGGGGGGGRGLDGLGTLPQQGSNPLGGGKQ
ncbi:MAG: prepilin-type N-terminal cleavage/methylation domain-containing protein [Planctomycetes bacterium]|nr:prepilin-type N-terminal cleavage/methylation domain-containing protein [Planctomycetota bacterium]